MKGFLIIFCIVLISVVPTIFISRMSVNSEISIFKELVKSGGTIKENDQTWWFASERYYNHTIFDIFIPDEVDSIDCSK